LDIRTLEGFFFFCNETTRNGYIKGLNLSRRKTTMPCIINLDAGNETRLFRRSRDFFFIMEVGLVGGLGTYERWTLVYTLQ
jgi:hypothetical protein